jgi:hypothetical protein
MVPALNKCMLSRALLVGVASLIAVASRDARGQYPNVDRAVAIADGDTVQLLNRILVDRAPGQRGARIDVHFSTRVPATDAEGRAHQADRLAQVIGAEAWKAGIRNVTIAICDTRACAETREPPKLWFAYQRGIGGVWNRSH